ncbi:MAG: 3-phosphoshikimate 1-carboxyvinyltransferase [Polyangiaceae bacterium]
MTDLRIHPQTGPLVGSVPVPSDKSIGHRALILGAIASGKSLIEGATFGEDNRSTQAALEGLGVRFEPAERGDGLLVHGRGLFGLVAPNAPLDCGNSGTTMRLLAGLLAGQSFRSELVGDASLSRRPMRRIVEPLRARGARIDGVPHPTKEGERLPPLVIDGLGEDAYLGPLELDSPIASAQVKSAALLSGLLAHGPTYVREPQVSRDHTERMLEAVGVPVRCMGAIVELDPSGWDGRIRPLEMRLPGDLSAAAFVLAAAALVPSSRVTVRGVGINPTRTGFLEVLRDMGAGLSIEPRAFSGGEPVGDVHAWAEVLSSARVGGELLVRAIDEVPILCALAARASGTSSIRDAEELRVKESDRVRAMADTLRAFGVSCEELPDGLRIVGTDAPLRAADVASGGDHRVAMTGCVLGLVADGPTTVRDVDCIRTSFPRFVGTLRALGARIEVVAADSSMH